MPAIADGAVWEEVTKGRAGKRWDSIVDKAWKEIGRNQGEILATKKLGGYIQDRKARERIEIREQGWR